MAAVAKEFQKIIHDGRERKKNEALAEKIFSRNRRQSAPSKLKASAGPSLASRVGVKKSQPQQRVASLNNRRASVPAGNVDGEWTHDLHDAGNARSKSLSSRITQPGAQGPKRVAAQRKSRLGAALENMDVDQLAKQPQVNIISKPTTSMGLTIRGLAGPYAVMGQNFAPGTTAADIESAMTPVGGEMVSCHIVKTSPFIIVEMLFSSREGGERVIETFNNKTADGRLIKVYPKIGASTKVTASSERNTPPANAPSGPRSSQPSRNAGRDQVVDGTMGFSDQMETDNGGSSTKNRPLYSDKLVGGNRSGRGFQRSRGGR